MLDVVRSLLFNKKLSEDFGDIKAVAISDELRSKFIKLGTKSIAIRVVDAGSTNNPEHEIAALENPVYDINRFGIKTVASPRHADMLLVTGPVTANMKLALIKAYEATPDPKIVVAVGDGAISGRISKSIPGSNLNKVSDCIPIDLEIAGDPPEPETILRTLLGVIKSV